MMLVIPMWLQAILAIALGFWIGIQYTQWKKDPHKFWKGWFD